MSLARSQPLNPLLPGSPQTLRLTSTLLLILDPGAVLCRSQADLQNLAARRSGEAVSGPVDCKVIQSPTGISILQRQGPSMVEVQTTDPRAGGVGWTDAWLPNKAPGETATATAR